MIKNLFSNLLAFKQPSFPIGYCTCFFQFDWVFIVASIAYIILSMNFPISIISHNIHDDALYMVLGQYLSNGDWLGPYNQMTLAKGSGYPIFLSINKLIGIPVTLSIAILHLTSCWLIAISIKKLPIGIFLQLTSYLIIIFHPILLPLRILRENIYHSLTMMIVSGAIIITTASYKKKEKQYIPFFGIVLGFFWITREEGVWILPGLLFLLLAKLYQLKHENLPIKKFVYQIAIFASFAYLPVLTVSFANMYKYGKFDNVEFKSAEFSTALESLNSVQAGKTIPYLPVSREKRMAIYAISPSFNELQDYFETKGTFWTKFGCQVHPHTCGDYAGGWFVWALRDAVAELGYYENPQKAAAFYQRITDEIAASCKEGLISCSSNPIPLMPLISMTQLKELPRKFIEAINMLLLQTDVPHLDGPSAGTFFQLHSLRFFLGSPKTTQAQNESIRQLSGWYYSPNKDWINLVCAPAEGEAIRSIPRQASQDIAKGFNDPSADRQRFSFTVAMDQNCEISSPAMQGQALTVTIPSKNNRSFKIGDSSLHFDSIMDSGDPTIFTKVFRFQKWLVAAYRLTIPILAIAGILGYLFGFARLVFSNRGISNSVLIATTLWILLLSRIILIILIDISSFPAININYLCPAFPLLCLASTISIALFWDNKEPSCMH